MSGNYSIVNPCVMCMPMGSVMAFRGIENTMPLFHGSQGCSTYIRLHLAHHFREQIDIASSALSEKGAVYGGSAYLKKGLKNVISGYNPSIIGVATTCLAETIGEDVENIIKEFRQEEKNDVIIIQVSTPSYTRSHEDGYNETIKAIVKTLAQKTQTSERINIIVGAIVSPEDVRYLKQLLDDFNCQNILIPDISETFDAPIIENIPKIPYGGTKIDDVRDMANSKETLTFGKLLEKDAGRYLEKNFEIPHSRLALPIGLEYSDIFVSKLEEITNTCLPRKYEIERGRLLDAMIDVHKYVANVKTCIFGDTEIVLGITKFICELGMIPSIVATGSNKPEFAEAIKEFSPNSKVMYGVDFTDIHEEIKKNEIELMIGPFTGRQISRKENIPLLRLGLPIHDRVGASRQLILGYDGAMRLLDNITNILLETKENKINEVKICAE